MQLKRKGWHYDLWQFGSLFSRKKGRGNYVHLEVYMRRITLGAVYTLYILLLRWIGWFLMLIAIGVPSIVLSLITNLVTVPTGFGISILYPDKKFIKIPFEIKWRGKHRSLSWFLTPLEVVIINLWLVFTHHPIERIVLDFVWIASVIVVVGFILAIKFVNTINSHIIEFID